ncbi:MAG: hypothetical protein Q8807_04065, partial ['Waltheria sp.' little leaf phytoplasma]|nr:hypothetical protein ['Waltheria sp.' little leaf phytoplasma]
ALFNELDWMTSDDDDDDDDQLEEDHEEEDSSNWVGLDPLQQQVNDHGIGAAVSSSTLLRAAADHDIIMDGNYYYNYINIDHDDNPVVAPPNPNAATLIPWVDAPEAPHHDNPSPPPPPPVVAVDADADADADAAVPLPLLMEVSHPHHQHVEEEASIYKYEFYFLL